MRGTRALLVSAPFLGLLLAPAFGKDVPRAADQLLWCGSAYYWLSNDAETAGNEAEADQYAGWSDAVMQLVVDQLKVSGFSSTEISDTIDASDEAVEDELGTDKARYDIAKCEALVPYR